MATSSKTHKALQLAKRIRRRQEGGGTDSAPASDDQPQFERITSQPLPDYYPQSPQSIPAQIGQPLQAAGQAAADWWKSQPSWVEQAGELEKQRQTDPAGDLDRRIQFAQGMVGPQAGIMAGRPDLWHGISQIRLPRPIGEMQPMRTMESTAERLVRPADLQGGQLLPAIGDRSAASGQLTGVGGTSFAQPVALQGGHGYMPANTERGAVWAAAPGVVSGLENKAKALAQTGAPVYFPYTAMGQRAVDFSHHVADALTQMLPAARIGREGRAAFNEAMVTPTTDFPAAQGWPGINSPRLGPYLRESPGDVRNKLAKVMDSARFQKYGFPSVAEARHAVTDPRLLDEPTGASGLSIAKLAPGAPRPPSAHLTYPQALPGQYVGGFGASVPKQIMYPDLINALTERGYPPLRHDYLMARPPTGTPIAQPATQHWVDSVSEYLRSKGVPGLERGGVAHRMASALAHHIANTARQ